MDSMSYNFGLEEQKQMFTPNTDPKPLGTESFTAMDKALTGPQESAFSPLAPPFQGRSNSDLLTMLAQQEPRTADPAPVTTELEDAFMNFRMSGSEMLFDDEQNSQNYYMGSGGNRPESVLTSNIWGDRSSVSSARNGEMMDTFDFLIKTNNYVSTLTREQLSVLRSIRPSLLYDFLQEVAKVRCDRRVRRALPNECAFCKNNGENEECYTSHALKDWRGRVLCPVLRAFRCPRCGATGDRAHTIKYCPENDSMSDRSGLSSRRRVLQPTSLLLDNPRSSPSTPAAPVSSPAPSTAGLGSFWSTTQLGGPFN